MSSHVGRRNFFLGLKLEHSPICRKALLVQGGVGVGKKLQPASWLMPGLVEVSQRGRLCHGDALIYVDV